MKLKKIAIFVKVYTKNYGSYRNDIFRDSFQQEYSKTPKGLFISVKLDIWVNGGGGGCTYTRRGNISQRPIKPILYVAHSKIYNRSHQYLKLFPQIPF